MLCPNLGKIEFMKARTGRSDRVRKPSTSTTGGVSRREFVKLAVVSGVAVAAAPSLLAAEERGGMIYRTLGSAKEKISAIGLGGYHIGVPEEAEGIKLVRTAIDGGINFLDNCWDYLDGESERRMGKALKDGYRDKAFLMTKIDGRSKTGAAKQIDESLKRLQTDRVDLMQFHEIIRLEDPEKIFRSGGAMEAVLEAKKVGKIRYIGFTGHKDPDMHLKMLEVAAANKFRFDAVQMPLNVMDAHFRSFEQKVLPLLVRDGIGVLGMKPMAAGGIPRSNLVTGVNCLHYALNLPTSTVITGCERMEILNQAFEAVRSFKPMSKEEVAALLSRTASPAGTGNFEKFKTTTQFDGTTQHPEWLS